MHLEAVFVIPSGLEPETYCLEGSCSIRLSYETGTYQVGKYFIHFSRSYQNSTHTVGPANIARLKPTALKVGDLYGRGAQPGARSLSYETP
jgi:hypothetical protein